MGLWEDPLLRQAVSGQPSVLPGSEARAGQREEGATPSESHFPAKTGRKSQKKRTRMMALPLQWDSLPSPSLLRPCGPAGRPEPSTSGRLAQICPGSSTSWWPLLLPVVDPS